MLKRIGVALGLLAVCVVSVLRVARPPRAVPATSPDTVFSAQRAMRHVEQIAQRPHSMGTADHDRVRDYILGQLSGLGMLWTGLAWTVGEGRCHSRVSARRFDAVTWSIGLRSTSVSVTGMPAS